MKGAGSIRSLKPVQSGSPAGRCRRLKKALTLVLTLALFLGLGWLLYRGHELFCRVEQIDVSGAVRLSETEIIECSGVKKGTSLFFPGRRKIEERLAALPEISAVTVKKNMPGALSIRVREKEAAASLLAGERFWLVDREGTLFAEEPRPAVNLPVITGVTVEEMAMGEPLLNKAKREALVAFLGALPQMQPLEAAELNLADPQNLVLYTADRRRVLLGDSEKMVQKMLLLQEASRLPGNGDCLDLRPADRLVLVAE